MTRRKGGGAVGALLTAAVLLGAGCEGSCDKLADPFYEPIRVSISPSNVSLPLNDTLLMTAFVFGGDRHTDVTNIRWSAAPEGIVSVTPTGVSTTVRGLARGTATVTATHVPSGVSESTTISVSDLRVVPGG